MEGSCLFGVSRSVLVVVEVAWRQPSSKQVTNGCTPIFIRMLRKIIFLLLVLLYPKLGSKAEILTFYDNGIRYCVHDYDQKSAEIIGYDYPPQNIVIPSKACYKWGYNKHYYTVTSISDNAFKDCKSITSITLNEKIYDIGVNAFEGCSNLKNFYVNKENEHFLSIDGILYDKYNRIYAFPPARANNYTIKYGTTIIMPGAFATSNLNKLIVPNSITQIFSKSFTNCNIKELEFAACIEKPSKDIFENSKIGALYIHSEISDFTFLKGLDVNSIVYVHPSFLEEAKKNFEGTVETFDKFYITEQTETLLGKVSFKVCSYPLVLTIPLNGNAATIKRTGKRVEKVMFNNEEISKNSDGTYTINNLSPQETKKIEIYWEKLEANVVTETGIDIDSITTSTPTLTITYDYHSVNQEYNYSSGSYNRSTKTNSITVKTSATSDESLSPSEAGSLCVATKQHKQTISEGLSTTTGLIPDSLYKFHPYAIYNGKQFVGKDSVEIRTAKPNIDIKIDSTQTTFTINSLKVIADEGTIAPKTIGFIYDGKEYIWNGKTISFKNLYPNRLYVIYPFAIYEKEHKITLNEKYIRTKSFHPSIYKISAGPTSIHVKGTYSLGDSKLEETFFSDHNGEGDDIVVTGLKPNTKYSFRYWVKASGASEYATLDVTTAKITLESQNPKVLGNNSAIVCAKTNIENEEKGAGFEWRKTDAPDVVVSKSGSGVVYGGMLEGRINNLSTSSYYKVRPFYKASDGTMYYGEWIGFDPSDFSYFEPTVHTYARVSVQSTSAKIKGVALQGTDDITEQGFEYWAENAIASRAAGDKQIIQATGQSMEAEITDLAPNTTYNYRAYAKTSKGTTYGETLKFTTPVATAIIGITNTTNSDLQFNVRNTNNVQIAINGTDKECNYRMNSITGANIASGKTTADGEWHTIANYQLPSGIYIITVSDGKDKKSTKIAIK